MKLTPDIEDSLLERASGMSGIEEKNDVIRRGLEALIPGESGKKLAQFGESEKQLRPIPRRGCPGGAARSGLTSYRTPGTHLRKKKYSWLPSGPSRSRSEASRMKPVSASSAVNSPVVKDVM